MSHGPTITVRGRPADDWPLEGKLGWGLGSRVRSKATGVVGIAQGAACELGACDWNDPACYSVSVRITGANGTRGVVVLPCVDLEAEPR